MAKTTSEIIKENQQKKAQRQAYVQAIRDDKNKNAETILASAYKTADVLNKAGVDSVVNPVTYEVERDTRTTQQKYDAAQKAYDDYKKTPQYRQEMAAENQSALRQAMDKLFAGGQDLPANLAAPVVQESGRAKALAAEAEHYRQQLDAERNQAITAENLSKIEQMPEEDRVMLESYVNNRNRDFNAPLELSSLAPYKRAEEEAAPLIQKYGKDTVDRLAESFLRNENAKVTEEVTNAAREKAGSGFLGAVGHSAATVGANLIGSMTGPLGYLQEAATRTGQYSTMDPNNAGNLPNAYSGAVRQEVAENIAGDEGKAGRKLLSYGYQGVMSAADSIARALAFGKGSLALAAMGSFSQTMSEASRQGATPEQAAILATGSAALEVATEYIPLDKMLSAAKGGAKPAMEIAREALQQAGIEAATEEISLFGNLLLEAAVLKDKSSYRQQIADAVANGASYDDAKKQANKSVWNEALQTAIVSGFSGAVSGGGSAWVGSVKGQKAPQTATLPETPEQVNAFVMEDMGQKMAQTAPKTEPVEVSQNDRLIQQAADEVFGAQPLEQQKNTAQTGGENDGLRPYTQHEKDNWKSSKRIVLFEGVEQFRQFIRNALSGNAQTNKKMYFGAVTNKLASKIANATGLNVEGYNLSLGENEIRKIKTSHGNEKKEQLRGQRAVTEDDYLNIPNVIQNADVISRSDSDYGGKPAIEFYKKNGNEVTAVVAVVSDKHLDIFVQTSYINKKTGSIATPESVQADSFTSETPGGTAPTNNIPEGVAGVKGVGAAEANFSGLAEYQNLLYEGNVQRDREGDVRPVEVPKTDTYGRNVSEFVGNAYGAEITPDSMAEQIEFLVQDGALGFDRKSNQDALNEAAQAIQAKGVASTRNQITKNIANGKLVDGDIEKALLLYASYANKKGKNALDNASEIFVDLTTMAHMSGRNLQLFGLLRKLTPEGQAMTIKKTVQRNVESMIRSGQVKKGYETEVDPELLKEYQEAAAENARAISEEQKEASAEKMREIQQAIFADEAAKMPATFKAKWDAWRYMAMLGNAKTQWRNFFGNVLFMPYKKAKDTMAAVFEKALPKDQRTKAVFGDRELMAWAKADAKTEDVVNALKYTGKISDDATNAQFAENRKVFNSKALETMRKVTEKLPQAGDMLFKNDYYARSLAGFLKARGYTASDIENGNISNAEMIDARSYAVEEAMRATFNDCNAFSDAFASFGRKTTDNAWRKAFNVIGEAVLPFRRTPANIVVRFAEYSPAGILKGAWDMATKVRNGDISAAAAIDKISSGLTGTGVMTLGYLLAKGIGGVKITGSGTDEDEKRQGHQDYALEFSIDGETYSYKIDWAAPANLPLFVGANIYKMMEDAGADTDVSAFTSILHGLGTMFEPMLALSCMSSLNDLVEGIRYAPEGEALYSAAADIATSYFTQGIPALARQAYQASQVNKQTTFANSDDPTIRDLQKVGAQIPFVGDQFQTDKINAWGETETTENGWERAFNAFLNPGTYKKIDNGPLETEIARLIEVQPEKVSPPVAAKTISYTDNQGNTHKNQRLTEEQYQALATTQGQTAKRLLTEIIGSKDYQSMTDAQKAATVAAVYEYAQEAGKNAALPDYYSTAAAWMGEIENDQVNGLIQRGAAKVLDSIIDDAVQALKKGWVVTEAAKSNMDQSFTAYENMSREAQQAIREDADGDTARFLEMRENGISTGQYIKAVSNVRSAKSDKNADKWAAIAKTTGLTEKEIDIVMKAYMADYDPEDDSPDKTELKYDYARQEMGLTSSDYARAYHVHADNSKKADRVSAWQGMGYSYEEANILYKLFDGKLDVEKWHKEQ